jgi:MFS family permease
VATLRSFKHRNYRILYPANAISNIGTWAQRVAQDWLVLELTGSSLYLGIVTGLQFAPALLFSMQGGKMADRFNKRMLLIYCNIGGFISSFALGLLILTDLIQLWHVFFFAFTLGLASALDAPVRQAFTSEIVGKEDLPNAVSLNSANFNAARLIGPGLSGLLIAAFGTGPSFILNSFSFLGVIGALYAIRERDLFIEAKPNLNSKVREAISYIKARPDLYGTMIVVFFATTFGFNFAIYNALMTTKVFGLGVEVFGALGSILAIGSLAGALLSAKFERGRSPKKVMFGVMGFGVALMFASQSPNFTVYAVILPITGFIALLTMITANSLMQVRTDPAIRGRVMGVYLTVFLGGTPIGSPILGALAGIIGIRWTMFLCGGITALAGVITYLLLKDRIGNPESYSIDDVLDTTYDQK